MTLTLEFGAMVRPLKQQLKDQGLKLPEKTIIRFEEIAWSIVFLHLQGIIPDSVRNSSHQKLMKQIVAELRSTKGGEQG